MRWLGFGANHDQPSLYGKVVGTRHLQFVSSFSSAKEDEGELEEDEREVEEDEGELEQNQVVLEDC